MGQIVVFIFGIFIGGLIVFLFFFFREKQREKDREMLRSIFSDVSQDALKSQSESFLQLAQSKLETQTKLGEKDLDNKKALIDKSLDGIKEKISEVEKLMNSIEKERAESFGGISKELQNTVEQTNELKKITSDLKAVLSNTKVRGQWGERMAEDILRMAGFIEGIQYNKQNVIENSSSRPDFTFNMPDGHLLNMDVKFPFNSYLNYLSTDSEEEREKYKKQFLKDAKARITELDGRNYINNNTLDYVLLFIPNEQVYSFINEHDSSLLDLALKRKVILCGPNTLYAILAVIRQASDNFHLEKVSSDVLNLLSDFKKQWGMYIEEFDKFEKQLGTFEKTFQNLKGVRARGLDKQFDKIQNIQNDQAFKALEESVH